MATKSLTKKIAKVAISKSSKTMDSSLFSDKIVYASTKLYDENLILSKLPISRLRTILKKIRKGVVSDLHHLKGIAISSDDFQSNLDVVSTLGFMFDNNEFFESIELYMTEDKYGIGDAIGEAIKDSEHTIDHLHHHTHDKVFLLVIMEQISYLEERMRSYARRFVFEEFSRTIDTDKIIIIQSFFKEIFIDFNPYIKGIIIREVTKDQSLAHFSIHFQIPIVQSSAELMGRKKIVILTETQEIVQEPTHSVIEKYHLQNSEKNSVKTMDPSILGERYRLYAVISNPLDMALVADNPWFDGIIFRPEHLIAAKGSPLTTEEWINHIRLIEQYANGKSIVFRLPAFDKVITTDDFSGDYPDKHSIYHHSTYYTYYLSAIAFIMNSSSSTISFHIPFIREEKDIPEWVDFIKIVMSEHDYRHDINMGFDLDFQSTLHKHSKFRTSHTIVFHLDSIIQDYVMNFHIYYDHLSLDLFKNSHAYADVIHVFQTLRHDDKEIRSLFMGHTMTSYDMFRRLLRAGYRNFGIHPSYLRHLIPIITKHVENKGKYIGLYQFNKERTLYYEQLRKQLGPNAVIKFGTYLKMLEEKEKNKNKK